MLNNEKITKIIARRYIWLPFLMGVLLGIVCFVVFTGYDRMKIEKIADETLDFMQDRVKKYDDYKNNDKVKSFIVWQIRHWSWISGWKRKMQIRKSWSNAI